MSSAIMSSTFGLPVPAAVVCLTATLHITAKTTALRKTRHGAVGGCMVPYFLSTWPVDGLGFRVCTASCARQPMGSAGDGVSSQFCGWGFQPQFLVAGASSHSRDHPTALKYRDCGYRGIGILPVKRVAERNQWLRAAASAQPSVEPGLVSRTCVSKSETRRSGLGARTQSDVARSVSGGRRSNSFSSRPYSPTSKHVGVL